MTVEIKNSRESNVAMWQQHIQKWQQSGLSIKSYCKQQSLPLYKFKYWQYKFNTAANKTSKEEPLSTITFTELAQLPQTPPPTFELYFNDNVCLKIPPSFDDKTLGVLIKTVRAALC